MFQAKMSAVLVLFLGSLACGQPPSLVIPAEVRPSGQYVRFSPQTDAVAVAYVGLSGLDAFPSEDLKDSRRFLLDVYGKPAGRYGFAAIASSKTGEQVRADFVVVIGNVPPGPAPVPPVPPGPGPKPDPTPDPIAAGKLYVVIIEETRNAVITRGVWFADRQLKAAMDSKGHKWRVVDQNVTNAEGQTPADVKRFIEDAKTKTLPMLYLVNENGKTVFSGAAPVDVSRLLELLTKFGG
jgi:hypothetical protein